MTGFGLFESGMGGKWVERLKQIAPRTAHIALLFNPTTTVPPQFFMSSIQAAASSFVIEVNSAPVHGSDEIEGVIVAQTRKPGGALIVMPDSFTTTNRELIIALAARHGVPAIYNASVFAKSGGLISYGSDFVEHRPILMTRRRRASSDRWDANSMGLAPVQTTSSTAVIILVLISLPRSLA
jgi:putative ABC transport system substrate-binding protein